MNNPSTDYERLLQALVKQRGEAKICFDEEDGWFLQFLYNPHLEDSWITLDLYTRYHSTILEAAQSAVEAHNEEIQRAHAQGRWTSYQGISTNWEPQKGLPTEVIPVIHVDPQNPEEQTLRNAQIAYESGCKTVFLIQMDGEDSLLPNLVKRTKEKFPEMRVGVNFLQSNPLEALLIALQNPEIDAVWTDKSLVDDTGATAIGKECRNFLQSNPQIQLFAGVGFKHQPQQRDLEAAATETRFLGAIPTTSGKSTGKAANPQKLEKLRETLNQSPLAVASGVTPENVAETAQYCTHLLVATGISSSFYEFCPETLQELIKTLRTAKRNQQ